MDDKSQTTSIKTQVWEAIRPWTNVTWENGPWVSTFHDQIHITGLSHLPACRTALSDAGVSYADKGSYLEIMQSV